MECGNTFWEVKVPELHVKCTVYHVDALQMAGVIKTRGGLPICEFFFCYFVFSPWSSLVFKMPNLFIKFFVFFFMKNFDEVIWHFKNQRKYTPKYKYSIFFFYSGNVS